MFQSLTIQRKMAENLAIAKAQEEQVFKCLMENIAFMLIQAVSMFFL